MVIFIVAILMIDFEVNRRLKKIIEEGYNTTIADFASKYEDKKYQKTYNVINERNGISNKMLDMILEAYPEINRVWLLTGEGEMFINPLKKGLSNGENIVDNVYERLIDQLEKRILDKEELINSLREQIELLKSQKKIIVPPVDDAASAVASGFSDK